MSQKKVWITKKGKKNKFKMIYPNFNSKELENGIGRRKKQLQFRYYGDNLYIYIKQHNDDDDDGEQ